MSDAADARPAGYSKVQTEAIRDDEAFARRVRWIDWDSGFRGSGLRVGDRVLGEQGERYTAETDRNGRALGTHSEAQRWDQLGLRAGDPLSLLVERDGQALTLTGQLAEQRSYRDADGKPLLGEGGPSRYAKDGFDYDWYAWYNQFQDLAKAVLSGWDYIMAYDTRKLREQVEPFRPRVDYLAQHYPGAFANAVREDFEAMLAMLAGERRELSEDDLRYRQLGELRAAQVAQAADAALQAFLAEVANDLLPEPFPAPDPFREDMRGWVGKVVQLPAIGDRDLLLEVKRSWYQAGGSSGVYLIDRHAEPMQRLFAAIGKYIEQVHPFLEQHKLAFVGLIEPTPALVSDMRRNATITGLRLRPLAARVADADDPARRFFVDLRAERTDRPAFAGADQLMTIGRPALVLQAGPAEVLQVFFESLKVADFDQWRHCFANWYVRQWFARDSAYLYVDQSWEILNERDLSSHWERARQRLLDDVDAVEVAWVSAPRVIFDAAAQAGAPVRAGAPQRVEAVQALVNHIGQFDGEFRTFAGYNLHRKWDLQRLDDGPWRIVSTYGI